MTAAEAVAGAAFVNQIDPYAAASPPEFFAVTSELFFERLNSLATERPALYEQLKRCYRLDPISW